MPVLYRKYRPKKFADVVGQNHIKVTVGNEIAQDSLAHAYLFVGPRGTGKTTMARLISRSINCQKHKPGVHEPCNTCDTCVQILSDKSLDIIEIDAATHTQVDNVRDNIITNTYVPPVSVNGYKVFIIDEVHMLSKHAFNALLKTIEEPPARVIFILATTDIYKVPETIISRCQRFDFKKIPQSIVIKRLQEITQKEKIEVPESVFSSIARRSEGCMRDAESLLGQIVAMEEKGVVSEESAQLVLPKNNWQYVEKLLEHLHKRNLPAALEFIHTMVEEGMDTELFISDIVEYVRQVLLKKSIGTNFQPDVDEQTRDSISNMSSQFSLQDLKQLLEIFMIQLHRVKNALIPELPLELGCIEFCDEYLSTDPLDEPISKSPKQKNKEKKFTKSEPIKQGIEIDILKQQWPVILRQLKEYNHSLSVFLKVAHPLSIIKNKLVIGFKFDFHAKTVNQSSNRKVAEKLLSEILKKPISIDCIIDDHYTENHKIFHGSNEKEVQDVLSIMGGGEVI